MPLEIIRQDITKIKCDAIVNAAKNSLLGGGGVDGAIHAAAGPGLLEECRTLGGCETGQAKITGGYSLSCRFVIHTVGPVWHGGGYGEEEFLRSCYRTSLGLAVGNGCESVAFPLISAGAFGYPKDEALHIAIDEIGSFLLDADILVYLVVYNAEASEFGRKLFPELRSYIDDRYVRTHTDAKEELRRKMYAANASMPSVREPLKAAPKAKRAKLSPEEAECSICADSDGFGMSLEERIKMLDESFSQMLLRKIDERGMTDAQCYRKANIDRKLFSKIRANPDYKPSKSTALAFAIALELPPDEVRELLMKAGYALSTSSKSDVIIQFFIENGTYDIFRINEALFAFDQTLLGGV